MSQVIPAQATADVVVIGGGIVGCACAYYLSQEQVKVHLVEKGTLLSGTSKACQCHIVLWELPEINLRLGRASSCLYEALATELPFDIEYRRTGSLAVVDDPADWPAFEQSVHSLQDFGVTCELLDGQDLARMEPNLATDLVGGAHFPEDGQVNPMLATLALARAAREHGAVIQTHTAVVGIEMSGEDVAAVNTTAGSIATRAVVNAAGVWSKEVGRLAGLDVPVVPRRGHIVVTEPVPNDLINCKIILAAGYMQTLEAGSGVAIAANIQQTRSGNLLLGSSREFTGFDWSVNPEIIRAQVARDLRFVPALAGIHAIRTYAGLRPHSPDLVPIVGEADEVKGFYMATGHEGAGITMGPITGKLISEMITGQKSALPVEQLSLSRFSQGQREVNVG
jgi:glycine/D-amino acid oxidase-like deaminating enzyme